MWGYHLYDVMIVVYASDDAAKLLSSDENLRARKHLYKNGCKPKKAQVDNFIASFSDVIT